MRANIVSLQSVVKDIIAVCSLCIYSIVFVQCYKIHTSLCPVCGFHQLILRPLLLINTAPSDHFYSWPHPCRVSPLPPPWPFSACLAGTRLAQGCRLPSPTHLKRDTQRQHVQDMAKVMFVCGSHMQPL